jgi:hypothetical protein
MEWDIAGVERVQTNMMQTAPGVRLHQRAKSTDDEVIFQWFLVAEFFNGSIKGVRQTRNRAPVCARFKHSVATASSLFSAATRHISRQQWNSGLRSSDLHTAESDA